LVPEIRRKAGLLLMVAFQGRDDVLANMIPPNLFI